jgi:CDP-diacylglycerol--serine O-phosphatidyltransferase
MKSNFKYWIPNFITLTNLSFGVVAVMLALTSNIQGALWLAFLCMVFDRFDGIAARKLGATSSFGMEMDSFADMVAFGVTPALLLYFISIHYSPHFGGAKKYIPMGVSILWVVASSLRLAKFNITSQLGKFEEVFHGWPMPIAAGFLLSPLLVMMKYFSVSGYTLKFNDPRLMGTFDPSSGTYQHWGFTVLVVWAAIIALGMISPLRVPKFKPPKIKWRRYYMAVNAGLVYVLVITRSMPEIILVTVIEFIAISLYFHLTAPKGQGGKYYPIREVMSWTLKDTDIEENNKNS